MVVSDMFVSKSHATTWESTDEGTYIFVHCLHVFLKIRSLQIHSNVIRNNDLSHESDACFELHESNSLGCFFYL